MLMRLVEAYYVACYRLTLVGVAGAVLTAAFLVHWSIAALAAYPLLLLLLVTWTPRQ